MAVSDASEGICQQSSVDPLFSFVNVHVGVIYPGQRRERDVCETRRAGLEGTPLQANIINSDELHVLPEQYLGWSKGGMREPGKGRDRIRMQ